MLHHPWPCNSMVGRLMQVAVCSPKAAGWGSPGNHLQWRDLGFLHAPDATIAQAQHDQLCDQLRIAGAQVTFMPDTASLSLDAVYAHDSSLATSFGAIVLNPGKRNRVPEGRAHREFF